MNGGVANIRRDDDRIVNFGQLCELLEVTGNTLRAIIAQAVDFPVLERGAKGVPYIFDRDQVLRWWRQRKAAEAKAAEARRRQLEAWRVEIAGVLEEDGQEPGLSPSERRRLAEAVLAEDRMRLSRGELQYAAEVEARLTRAGGALQRRLITMPQRLAKRFGWSREDRVAVESEIRATLNAVSADIERGILDSEHG